MACCKIRHHKSSLIHHAKTGSNDQKDHVAVSGCWPSSRSFESLLRCAVPVEIR
ncbi:hypothetical protein M378DRAFT_166358 [Amanita muscaria Koide BX008]|uniref:Uncharacterized protein n=1 Tax=Amanita muscaria (strain Koide BX008) TaxID=946122 RepID=A0A0C2WZN0_AMAMK|nr:hypothetical protein M378DRAFT_166358 [Amanita muscaria Koide BX008]